MTLPAAIRDILVCPVCRGPLRGLNGTPAAGVPAAHVQAQASPVPMAQPSALLECLACDMRYPFRDGILVLLGDADGARGPR